MSEQPIASFPAPRALHLRDGGVSFVLGVGGASLPRVLHWGADLGPDPRVVEALLATDPELAPTASLDGPRAFTVLPTEHEGWSGTPGLAVHSAGTRTAPRLRLRSFGFGRAGFHPGAPDGTVVETEGVTLDLVDEVAGIAVALGYRLDTHGVLRAGATLTRCADATGTLDVAALRLLLPLPSRANEVIDFTGRWTREFAPQRGPLRDGTHVRAARRGRPGHDTPLLLIAGTDGVSFRSGEAWSTHVAWSGNSEYLVERLPEGAGAHSAVLGGGELAAPGEIRLAPGETYSCPDVVFVWSDGGLDGISARLHASLRARPSHPDSPRPLVLNTWEAVTFDHDLARLTALADRAAVVGVERFVLDDGWFTHRRSDKAGLGDWTVDESVWPGGLDPVVEHVRGLGMQFGLWFEPEMVNLDSDLAREHPDWLLAPQSGPGLPQRHQHVLDLGNHEVWAYLLERIDALVVRYRLEYLKWDHNRDVLEGVQGARRLDAPGVHDQTLAYWELLDELRSRHPGLEIETCASGGGRVDLGVMDRTDRVWASDTIDPLERQSIQRWIGMLLPPELVGSHVSGPLAHTTGRVTELSFRLATALFAHAGIEWDLTRCSDGELAQLRAWAELYKEVRGLVHSGVTVRADLADPSLLLHGVVAPDQSEALYLWGRTVTGGPRWPGRIALPGLDPGRDYRVRVRTELGEVRRHQNPDPDWLDDAMGGGSAGAVVPGALLTGAGVTLPTPAAANAWVLHVTPV